MLMLVPALADLVSEKFGMQIHVSKSSSELLTLVFYTAQS